MFLSLILCSRNDNYLGNSLWRLETTLNFISDEIFDAGLEDKIEIILTDWGSHESLRNSLNLSNTASQLTKFLEIPYATASKLQKDSDFGEVLALNAAIRRASGEYVARIDQDTLVTQRFFTAFFNLDKKSLPAPMEKIYFFAARRHLPYDFVKTSPPLWEVKLKIYESYGTKIEEMPTYWHSPVGILLMHKNMWYDCGGFDERLIYYWWMDVDLGTRLIKKYTFVNIGALLGYEFFHLEHFPPEKCDGTFLRASHKKLNPRWAMETENKVFNPNGDNWGLKDQKYVLMQYEKKERVLDNLKKTNMPVNNASPEKKSINLERQNASCDDELRGSKSSPCDKPLVVNKSSPCDEKLGVNKGSLCDEKRNFYKIQLAINKITTHYKRKFLSFLISVLLLIKKKFPRFWIFSREFLKRKLMRYNLGKHFLDFFRIRIFLREKNIH